MEFTLITNPVQPLLGWVLAARDPEKLAHFYAVVFDARCEPGVNSLHWRVCSPLLELDIYRPSRQYTLTNRGCAFAPCLRFAPSNTPDIELQHQLDRLLQHGVSIVKPSCQREFGTEAWVADPEGNGILLLVPLLKL
ncbi:glyoxalase/bleomycin resistance/dioxygenase family protein [cyanobiont of Ornithocercus magnificus]|nr:glyoxalase/bleomycin resistance/dioxygenase family protein [cyanobiont of Ornithocercus magnificus]